jgi:hypothetical protein
VTPCSHIKIHGRILYCNPVTCNPLTEEPNVPTIHGRVEEVDFIIINTLKIDAVFSSRTWEKFNQATRLHIPWRGNAIYRYILHSNFEKTVPKYLDGWTEHLSVSYLTIPTNALRSSGFFIINTFHTQFSVTTLQPHHLILAYNVSGNSVLLPIILRFYTLNFITFNNLTYLNLVLYNIIILVRWFTPRHTYVNCTYSPFLLLIFYS